MGDNLAINASGITVPLPKHRVHVVPAWVTALLNLPAAKVAFLEVPLDVKCKMLPYTRPFLEFLGQVAVDVTESVPGEAASEKLDGTSEVKSMEGKNRAEREYPGTLTSLGVSLGSPTGRFTTRVKSPSGKIMPKRMGMEELADEVLEPQMPPVLLGHGSARLKHEGKDIAVLHANIKELGQMLYMYAESPELLRSLVTKIIRWDFERNQPDRTPRRGKYELYTLKLMDAKNVLWQKQGWKKSRKMTSIILPEGQIDSIVSDFQRFMSKGTKEWYSNHGLPHRRSYLFHGPPGTGKTSTIIALAGELQISVCFMMLGDDDIGNSQMQDAMRMLPRPCLLVIEDVDALFNEDRKTKNMRSPLTFSGLLNVLDGLMSMDGVVTILTTNYIDKLDPALLRAGRVDRRFKFDPPSRTEVAALFTNFYPDSSPALAKEFAEKVFDRHEKIARNIATLHQHFIYTRDKTARESVDTIEEFFAEFYPGESGNQTAALYS